MDVTAFFERHLLNREALKQVMRHLFPPRCSHCKLLHDALGTLLCQQCVQHMEVIAPHTLASLLVTFEQTGPAFSLMQQMKKMPTTQLASLFAAYMTMQLIQSGHDMPDFITAVPSSIWRTFQLSGCPTQMMAKEMAILLKRPFISCLKRKKQLVRQDLLEATDRKQMPDDDFTCAQQEAIQGKTVLLIDDTITTGTTLFWCSEKLKKAGAKHVIKMACVDKNYLNSQ